MRFIRFFWIVVSLCMFVYAEAKEGDDTRATRRIEDYTRMIESLRNTDKERILRRVNTYLNGLLGEIDAIANKREDYWQTPREFLLRGVGDCEDYAIIKYITLLRLGFDPNKLYLTVVTDRYSATTHMVLSYFASKQAFPLILDNLSFKILPLDKRTDLAVGYFINDQGVFVLDKNRRLKKTASSHEKFADLQKRLAREGFSFERLRKKEKGR